MKKLKFFSLLAAMLFATSMWATDPMGSVDGAVGKNGSLYVNGWALDPDDGSKTVEVHVYIFSSSTEDDLGKAVKGIPGTYANLERPDLKGNWGTSVGELYGTKHGFDRTIDISDLSAGTYYVQIYALNVAGSGTNPRLSYSNNGGYKQQITLSAPFTVSYNANGGSGAPGSQKKCSDITLKLSTTTPTRAGYTFNGWNTNSSGTGTNYAAGANYTANASVTLYAKWTANKYTVTLDQQGGSGGSSSVQATYNANMPAATMPTRTGYTFLGYYDATSGGTQYYKADGSSARTWNKTSNATLYARWTANTYTITLDPQGGAGGDATKTATFGQATPTVNIPGRNGYSFGGYYTQKNGGGTQYLKPDANNTATSVRNWDIASNTTLYAKWNARTYTVTFDQQGGNGGTASATATFDANMPAATMPTRTGYTFQGYYDATSGGTLYYNADGTSARTWNKTAAATLYARWTLINYTISYVLNGGTATNPTSYNVETATFTLNNPSKDHSDFLGWTGSNGDSPQLEVSIAKGSTGDKNYVANWLLHTYTLESDETMATDWTVTPSPVGVGQTVTATYSGTKHVKSVTYMGVPVVTAPTAKQGLTYTGSEQALVVAGSTTGGTLQYQLNGGEWSTTVPSATNAGTYEVAYRVLGNDTFVGNDGGLFNVSIAKADPNMSLSVTSLSMTADDFSKDITVTRSGDGAITASSSSTTYAKPTVSGNKVTVHRAHGAATSSNVTITVNVAESSNYKSGSKTCTYSQAVLRTPATATSSDKGRFLGIYGYLWKSKADAAYGSEPLVAVVAVVGSCNNYFTKCLCIALEDISSSRLSRADAATALNTWASSHSVNVHGTVYSNDAGGYYDWASSSNYKIRDNSYGVGKGWRLPTVCDWRYIMNSYLGWSLTNPAGVSHGVNPGLGQWSSVRTAINNATGGTAMKTDNNYGSSTRADGNSNIGTWHCGNGDGGNVTWWWANDHDGYKYYYRAVFAY